MFVVKSEYITEDCLIMLASNLSEQKNLIISEWIGEMNVKGNLLYEILYNSRKLLLGKNKDDKSRIFLYNMIEQTY